MEVWKPRRKLFHTQKKTRSPLGERAPSKTDGLQLKRRTCATYNTTGALVLFQWFLSFVLLLICMTAGGRVGEAAEFQNLLCVRRPESVGVEGSILGGRRIGFYAVHRAKGADGIPRRDAWRSHCRASR